MLMLHQNENDKKQKYLLPQPSNDFQVVIIAYHLSSEDLSSAMKAIFVTQYCFPIYPPLKLLAIQLMLNKLWTPQEHRLQ